LQLCGAVYDTICNTVFYTAKKIKQKRFFAAIPISEKFRIWYSFSSTFLILGAFLLRKNSASRSNLRSIVKQNSTYGMLRGEYEKPAGRVGGRLP
jgi:hypothetical protein